MSRRICVVTGSRAEYGLLRWVMEGVKAAPDLDLQLLVTGMHLSTEFGLTFREIEADGFQIAGKVEMLLAGDTPSAIASSMGLGLIGFGDAFRRLQPDLLLVLGDRFEIFSAVAAALVARVPVAHLHGGERTDGAIDDAMRHSITKMSHLHFVAAEEYRARVLQLGESPDRVFVVGGLGVDTLTKTALLGRETLERDLDFKLGPRNLVVTFHPSTLESGSAGAQLDELLAALHDLIDTHLIFTMPNADADGRVLFDRLNAFVAEHTNARVYTSLGAVHYLSCLHHADGVVGNSSSGLLEAPSFRKGTVNIGDRQKGRLRSASVIDCAPDRASIAAAIRTLYSPTFQERLATVSNPYGAGGASEKIVDVLRKVSLDDLVRKVFVDMPTRAGAAS